MEIERFLSLIFLINNFSPNNSLIIKLLMSYKIIMSLAASSEERVSERLLRLIFKGPRKSLCECLVSKEILVIIKQ